MIFSVENFDRKQYLTKIREFRHKVHKAFHSPSARAAVRWCRLFQVDGRLFFRRGVAENLSRQSVGAVDKEADIIDSIIRAAFTFRDATV